MRDDGAALDPRIVQSAIAWLLKVQNDARAWPACEAWQREHVDHARAWQRVALLNAELGADLRTLAAPGDQASQAVDQTARRLRQRRQVLKLLSLAAVGAGVAWVVRDRVRHTGELTQVATAIGERRRIQLEDGSLLALNTDSAADLRFDSTQRLIVLRRGELLIVSGADRQAPRHRPLRVQTRDGLLEAVGTRFVVRLRGDDTGLVVQEGQVHVRPAATADFQALVGPGESVRVNRTAVRAADPDGLVAAAWEEGVLDVRDMRLDAFLAEVARYRRGRLTWDPSVAALHVSGIFQLENPERLLALLPSTLPVALEQREGGEIHVRPGATPASRKNGTH